jgi:hypothetical protein
MLFWPQATITKVGFYPMAAEVCRINIGTMKAPLTVVAGNNETTCGENKTTI